MSASFSSTERPNVLSTSAMDGAAQATLGKVLKGRLVGAAIAAAAVVVLLKLTGALDHLSIAAVARHREWLVGRVDELGLAAPVVFVLVYAVFISFSLPTGLLMSTLGGFLFGPVWGGLFNVVGATLGATTVFLAAKRVLGDLLRARAGPFLQKLEAGFRENELSYMLVLRLVPLLPFWVVNLAPALLGVRLSTFVIGTFIGIIPGAFVYASIGTGLDTVLESGSTPDSSALFQPRVALAVAGLVTLALIPVAYKRLRRSSPHNAGSVS